MLQNLQMLAAYNEWANHRLYAAAQQLTPEELNADRGAFFGSLFLTLTHLLVADRIWLRRFTGEGPSPCALDEKPFAALADLTAARQDEDRRIIDWCATLTEERVAAPFSYTPITNPTVIAHKLGPALVHCFNHQTHHRGQAHATLTALGKPSLTLDLIYFLRQEGQQWL
ncbi:MULTISPECIES: DinB family protein [Alphaproteobacteria]|uniref:Damage-inducible protein DinB n=2 Tax=Alphaproteobacteria TaxID=28211 RepID=A0A512HGH2_9HYPH|nr:MULTISPECIES: DinB family protein [Alphaproteobacteria]GEO84559.1 damage-inducible protein DinB [Ciceribacter naphthalenivorans]GLR22522.1 damage-inducible protein DinB [Ciceribacter naphthalenivorans]GLT05378.1 damage-inducible protein DinB [Sphingomonas psychrolutea]